MRVATEWVGQPGAGQEGDGRSGGRHEWCDIPITGDGDSCGARGVLEPSRALLVTFVTFVYVACAKIMVQAAVVRVLEAAMRKSPQRTH